MGISTAEREEKTTAALLVELDPNSTVLLCYVVLCAKNYAFTLNASVYKQLTSVFYLLFVNSKLYKCA